jgi:phenylpyruvate tautomerase PptA (4-oxalocrotonate tautomerase family)
MFYRAAAEGATRRCPEGPTNREKSTGKIMPVYECYSPKGLLTKSRKAKIAEEITGIHCNATGALELWVNVVFLQLPEGECLVAGKPATHSYIFGLIRTGRDVETRQAMMRQFSQMWTRITGQSQAHLWVSLSEVDAANVMDAGLIVPEPGHEDEWLEENRARLAELGITAA